MLYAKSSEEYRLMITGQEKNLSYGVNPQRHDAYAVSVLKYYIARTLQSISRSLWYTYMYALLLLAATVAITNIQRSV